MAVQIEDSNDFDFRPGFAECIAQAANSWAYLEYYINSAIWALAETAPGTGACITQQIVSLTARLNALLALMKLRQVDEKLITRVNKFAENVRGPTEMRNRLVHDLWMLDGDEQEKMGQLTITAPKKLRFSIESVELKTVEDSVRAIMRVRNEMHKIRVAILAALPTLPKIPHASLHPITETPPVP